MFKTKRLYLSIFILFCLCQDTQVLATSSKYWALIDKDEMTLTLYQGDYVIRSFSVSIGATERDTPEGEFTVVHRIEDPAWKGIPGGASNNPLGKFWIGLDIVSESGERYGIHGTNQPDKIGEAVSEGCIRMLNEDISFLVWQLDVGSKVVITSSRQTGYIVQRDRQTWVKVWGEVPEYSSLWDVSWQLL